MNGWVILVDHARDFPNAETPHKVITTSDYLARPKLFAGAGRAKIVNLSRSYNYQSKGYYASLLAEARGHRVIPTVETMLELREHKLYEQALPDLQEALTAAALSAHATRHDLRSAVLLRPRPGPPLRGVRPAAVRLVSLPGDGGDDHARQALADRPPARAPARQARPRGGGILPPALHQHTERDWRNPRARSVANIRLPCFTIPRRSCRLLARDAPAFPEVRRAPFGRGRTDHRQLAELAEFDGLFIRATTSIDNYTYRFARRALQEGMPVIDDPVSMIRCTNKVYLHELMEAHGVPIPPTVMLAEDEDLAKAAKLLGWPMVVKIPDGSFSRGVHKVEIFEALEEADRRILRGHRPAAGAEIHADRLRLAGWRARRRAAVRLPISHGARPLADHQARAGRREGGRLRNPGDRRRAAARDRRRAARRAGDRHRSLRRRRQGAGDDRGDRSQRQSQPRPWRRGSGRQGRVWSRILQWFIKRIDA